MYSIAHVREQARGLRELSAADRWLYALKANPHPEILRMVFDAGLHFDASSSYEAEELLTQGIPGTRIALSSQQSPHDLEKLLTAGVLFTGVVPPLEQAASASASAPAHNGATRRR